MIQRADTLPPWVKEKSIRAFHVLAEAEAKTHGSTIENVHFHEVGAVDSIVDTVGSVLALHLLGVDTVFASPIPFGAGTVWTSHGKLPVPAPATLRLLQNVPTCAAPPEAPGELVTPTGAALLRALVSSFGPPPPGFVPLAVGCGAGTKEFPKHPNLVRVTVGELRDPFTSISSTSLAPPTQAATRPPDQTEAAEGLVTSTDVDVKMLSEVCCNIDDMTAEQIAAVRDLALEDGAADAWIVSTHMKKGRVGTTLYILCRHEKTNFWERWLLTRTTTFGVRSTPVRRSALRREFYVAETSLGQVRVKVGFLDGKAFKYHAELDACKRLVSEHPGSSIKSLCAEAERIAEMHYRAQGNRATGELQASMEDIK